jgi:HEAT repeat protein
MDNSAGNVTGQAKQENNQDTIESWISDLGGKNSLVREKAYDSLRALGDSALKTLVKALSNPNERIRWEANRLLDEIGVDWTKHADAETIDALIGDLNSKDGLVRVRARLALVAISRKAVDSLAKALDSKDQVCRWEAAKALGQIGDPAAITILIQSLEDEIFDVRWLASEGLIGIGRPVLAPLLHRLIKRPESIWLREGAHHILHGIYTEDTALILKSILDALESDETSLQIPLAAKVALDKLE